MKWLKKLFCKFSFDFAFDTKQRDPESTAAILSQAYSIEGFKEMLANDVFWYRRKAVEAKDVDLSAIHYAEAYQRLIDKMQKSREYLVSLKEKQEQDKIRLERLQHDQYASRY